MPQNVQRLIPAPTLIVIIAAVMAALYGIDRFLAAQEQSEVDQEASRDYTEGRMLLNQQKPHQAAEAFARAHALNRGNREYLLALADAQTADRQFANARDTLNESLESDSNDGRANLLMAHLMAAEGKFKDADFFYHRAIYGEWPSDALKEAAAARLQLVDMLAQHGNSQELLSELLLLQIQPDEPLALKQRIAALLLKAGSPERAAAAYRDLIKEDRNDADLFVGLGEAETVLGNYRAAENAYLDALRRRMNDPRIQAQLSLVGRIAALDPTLRRLSMAEKYRRSTQIEEMAQNELNACMPNQPTPEPSKPVQGEITNDMAEAQLDQAEKVWRERQQSCNRPPAPDDPLPFLMKKLAQ